MISNCSFFANIIVRRRRGK